ncbi:MAG: calcium/sodium antiporter [Clostridia bacterium]|nr:calcium/sodium antiporter [Clostridia bacterium]
MIIINIGLLILGIILLIKGSDLFVDSGSRIGKILNISEILLGMTIVSFGTSLPELIVAINGAQTGSNGVVIGNIIGTNIFNVCAILAILCIIKPIKFLKETVRKDMYMSLLSTVVLFVLMADRIFDGGVGANIINRADGIILLLFFGVFIYYSLYHYVENRHEKPKEEVKLKLKDIDELTKKILFMMLGIAMVFIGGDIAVDSVVKLASALHISETFIAIMVLAIGTSLPEIFTSIAAVKKHKNEMAIGNLIGSSIFNILFVLGTSSLIHPIALPMDSLLVDTALFAVVSAMLIMFARNKGKYEMSKLEGYCLLAIYATYVLYVIIRK